MDPSSPTSPEELQAFMSKIDRVNKIITDMASGKQEAVAEADSLIHELDSAQSKVANDRTVINKATSSASAEQQRADQPQSHEAMSQEAFMKYIEQDAEQRAQRRQKDRAAGAKLKDEGNTAFRNKDYATAEALYTDALRLWPDSLALYNNRAQARLKLNKFVQAEDDCKWALRLDRRNNKSNMRMGIALYNLERFGEAVEHLTSALKASVGTARQEVQRHLDEANRRQSIVEGEHKVLSDASEGRLKAVDSRITFLLAQLRETSAGDTQTSPSVLEPCRALSALVLESQGQATTHAAEVSTLFRLRGGLLLIEDSPIAASYFKLFVELGRQATAPSTEGAAPQPGPGSPLESHDTTTAAMDATTAALGMSAVLACISRFVDGDEASGDYLAKRPDTLRRLEALVVAAPTNLEAVQTRTGRSTHTAAAALTLGVCVDALRLITAAATSSDQFQQALAKQVPEVLYWCLNTVLSASKMLDASAAVMGVTTLSQTILNAIASLAKDSEARRVILLHENINSWVETLVALSTSTTPQEVRNSALEVLVAVAESRPPKQLLEPSFLQNCSSTISSLIAREGDRHEINCRLALLNQLAKHRETRLLDCADLEELGRGLCACLSDALLRSTTINLVNVMSRSDSDFLKMLVDAGFVRQLCVWVDDLSSKQDLNFPPVAGTLARSIRSFPKARQVLASHQQVWAYLARVLSQTKLPDSIAANLAIGIADMLQDPEVAGAVATALEDSDIVKSLLALTHTNTPSLKQNAAVCLARLARARPTYLERLRELGGIEILLSSKV